MAGTRSALIWSIRAAMALGDGSPKLLGWAAPTISQP